MSQPGISKLKFKTLWKTCALKLHFVCLVISHQYILLIYTRVMKQQTNAFILNM